MAKNPEQLIDASAAPPAASICEVFNYLKRENGPCLSIGEINTIAAAGWAGKTVVDAGLPAQNVRSDAKK